MRKVWFKRRGALVVGALILAAGVAAPFALTQGATAEGQSQTYLVLFHNNQADTAAVTGAGGTVVAAYAEIGVVIAKSGRADFASTVKALSAVEGVSATSGYATQLADDQAAADVGPETLAAWGDTLSGRQWDMTQIHVPEAHAITQGSPTVVVGDLDTGLDFTHPDLAPNYDASRSADCTSGVAQPLLPGNAVAGHGTHTAGTIAAAANGIGIVGVAPHVKIAGIKTGNDSGYFFPEAVICSYMWVATHGIDITNNSYFADPWLFNCHNDPDQRAIWKAERRAIQYAQSRGTLVIASEGNNATDLSHPHVDVVSPDSPPGSEQEREITNACSVVPVEVSGVLGVTATGNLLRKSYYSSYGQSTADVAAPGGDAFQITPAAINGRVLSTWPSAAPCTRVVFDGGAKYCYLQGTSMAGPHVVGVAALIKSLHPNLKGNALAAAVQQATDARACPTDMSPYASTPQSDGSPQACSGGTGHNSFYGSGEVNALTAVS